MLCTRDNNDRTTMWSRLINITWSGNMADGLVQIEPSSFLAIGHKMVISIMIINATTKYV